MVESELIECRVGNVHITPEQIGDVNIGTYGSEDYVLSTGNQIKAELITNNTVRVFDGVMVYGGLRDAVPVNKYYDITIDNGSQGKNRNDIIVRRYTKDDDSEKKARAVFTVVKGTPTDGTAVDPEITATDIRAGALSHDMKLHRVRLEGLNIVAVEPLFDVLMPMSEQQDMLSELNRKWTDEIAGNNQYCKYRYIKFGKTAIIIGNLAANNNNNISITFPFAFKFTPSASVTLESSASSNVNPLITEISTTSFKADSTPGSTSKTAARFIIIGEIE